MVAITGSVTNGLCGKLQPQAHDGLLMRVVEVTKEPVELYKILKFEGMVGSGGEAKFVIAEGHVLVNGEIETRKRKKIVSGDIIEFGQDKIRIQLIHRQTTGNT
jgi:ribosome-associated protein